MEETIYDAELVDEYPVGQYLGKFPNHIEGEVVNGEDISRFAIAIPNGVRAAWRRRENAPEPSISADMHGAQIDDQTPLYKPDLITLIILCIGVVIAIPVLFLFFAPK